MIKLFVFMGAFFALLSCSSAKKAITEEPEVITEYHTFDTLMVTAPRIDSVPDYSLAVYRPSYLRSFDLIHTKLDLRFDWNKEHVFGKAYLALTPLIYPQTFLILDAKGFDIHEIRFENRQEQLSYTYDGYQIKIDLGREFKRGEMFNLYIDYTAKPSEIPVGGSSAITSDKGLYFINADGSDPDKPQQIWTQGQTEANSRWFPTIDKPNERCTQEIYLTVQDRFVTLSNGLLMNSIHNLDGTRTDYWKMNLTNPPYLFMIAIGEYALVKDSWNGVPIEYYVEPAYRDYAKQIFNHTGEMMSFFSDYTGVPYPWPKMAHIAVRDYVSGAMENTTGVVYGEYVQKSDRQLIDNHNDGVVAHEIIHHWFGDLVTTESWANIVLNEGFANYGEFLWLEHKYGIDEAELLRINEFNGYIYSAKNRGVHPLVDFSYADKEDMFDAHSYNKGGLVMHMLRRYLGDDAFRAGLKKYLLDNAYSDVEVHELRLAMEDVSGEDLNWFFDQWFYYSGHPSLNINYQFDSIQNKVLIDIEQIQDPVVNLPIYQLPAQIYFYSSTGDLSVRDIWLSERKQNFTFKFETLPVLADFDGPNDLLFEKTENKTSEQYALQYSLGKSMLDQLEALVKLTGNTKYEDVFVDALDDDFYAVRRYAVNNLNSINDHQTMDRLKNLALNDPRSEVRRSALRVLRETHELGLESVAERVLENDLAYPVLGEALMLLSKLNPQKALQYAEENMDQESGYMESAMAQLFSDSGKEKYLSFFNDRLRDIYIYRVFNFYDQFFNLLKVQTSSVIMENALVLSEIALDDESNLYRRYAATLTIHKLKTYFTDSDEPEMLTNEIKELDKLIQEIINQETNELLKSRYKEL